jgi:chromosome segregation protein
MSGEMNQIGQEEPKKRRSTVKPYQFNMKIGDEELYEELIKLSNLEMFKEKEDFARHVVALLKMQDQRAAADKYGQVISEFERSAKRMAEIFVGFVGYVMDEETQSEETLSFKDEEIGRLLANIENLRKEKEEAIKSLEEAREGFQRDKEDLEDSYQKKKQFLVDEIDELKIERDKSNAFAEQQTKSIADYQKRLVEKDQELSKYKHLQDENEELKNKLYEVREDHQKTVENLKKAISDKTDEINDLNQQLKDKDNEKRSAVLEAKEEHQQAIANANEKYNNRVGELLEQNNTLQSRIYELEKQLGESERNVQDLQGENNTLQKQLETKEE